MSLKPVIPRERARRDMEDAADRYGSEAGEAVALGFIRALQSALQFIARRPQVRSPGWAHELDLPGLRAKRVGRYPYLIFYVEREDHVDVWRVLHERRDIAGQVRRPSI
ncbi:type II toxin-antitoxin system RelE/ParE family toxin [Caulobacter sp. KR2-114]|uniref:type II toxin-antitoxin system RelE/ParE family toxin n=1 Tax=Caulobacter sp. KR2-114 TaxID=3400912 RepID=UPI003C0B8F3A